MLNEWMTKHSKKKKAPHDYKNVQEADRSWTYQRWISKRVQKADSIVRDDVNMVRVSHINYYTQQEPFTSATEITDPWVI